MITKYGLPQAAVYPCLAAVAMCLLAAFLPLSAPLLAIEAALFAALCWAVSFFRDPPRKVALDGSVLYSPCDGTVTSVAVEEGQIRISVFLSIFNVHINRAPCNCNVEGAEYKKGEFRDARDPESRRVNESNDLFLSRVEEPKETLCVRQVSGAIARRIVCEAKRGDSLKQGERYGMIKFGSRTELVLPAGEGRTILAKANDKVKAGLTPLVRYNGQKKAL